jgi:hypothetical protein
VDEDQLANLHLNPMLMKDHMNRTNEDRLKWKDNKLKIVKKFVYHNLDFAIEQDLMVTMVDYLFVIVVDLIENDFVLVDLFVDYKMDNVVVEQQVQLVDIVIVVVNVVLKKTKFVFYLLKIQLFYLRG